GSIAVFCPTSNLFLGSGLFDRDRLKASGVRMAVATDVGGGTSFSMLRTMDEGYKVLQLREQRLNPFQSFYMMTLGNARALSMEDKIGTLDEGTEADIVVLDSSATSPMRLRMAAGATLEQELFLLQTLGDDRAIVETYVAGKPLKAELACLLQSLEEDDPWRSDPLRVFLLKLFRAFAAHGTGKLVGGGADQRPELLEPLFRQAHCGAGNGNAGNRLAIFVEYGSSDAAHAERVFLIIDRPATGAGCLNVFQERGQAVERALREMFKRTARKSVRDFLVRPGGQYGLADAGSVDRSAPSGPEKGAHRRMAFDLRDEHDIAAIL